MTACFENLKVMDPDIFVQAAHITLLLPDMSLFAPANAVYAKYFGTSPPSRATVAVPLPPGETIRIGVIGYKSTQRQALHVQGLSYWAPANIGPYSQAVIVDSRVHIAGQIPLIPANLTLAPPSYATHAVLALQHARTIIKLLQSPNSTGGGWTGWMESCIAWWAAEDQGDCAVVRQAWALWAETSAPIMFVRAKQLPRDALVEFQVNLNTGRSVEDDEAVYDTGESGDCWWETCRSAQARRSIIFCKGPLQYMDLLKAVSLQVYYTCTLDEGTTATLSRLEACITYIPVYDASDRHGRSADLAIEVLA